MIPRKRSRWWKWLLALALLGCAAGGWRWYANRSKNDEPEYKTATVTRGDITQSVSANGQLSAVKNVTVGSQVSGIITDIKVDFNSRVTNGQVVAQIDPSTYQQNITQAEAEVVNAKAGLELAELNMRRARELRTNELISAAEYDQTLVALHQAEAVVTMREASLKRAKVDLERTTIYSPIDGVVISRAVDVGQTVAASFNAPTLFNIANDLRHMRIEAMVSEADVGGVQEGQRVTFTVEAFPGRQFRGEVTQVRYAPVTNQNVVTYTAVVEVDNEDLKLRPGMTATVSIITDQRRNVLRIPSGALRFRPPETATAKTSATPAAGAAGSTNKAAAGATNDFVASGPSWGEGGERPSREEMRKRFESMTPEERAQMRERFRARFGDGPPGGGFGGSGGGGGFGRFGGGPRAAQEGPVTRTVYVLDKAAPAGKGKAALKPVTIKAGISDGASTEVLEGLNEGDVIVIGSNAPTTAGAQPPGAGNPFGPQFGRGFRPR